MSRLTPRELEIVRMASRPNKEIATALGIKVGTVKQVLHSAFSKLGARDRADAMRKLAGVSRLQAQVCGSTIRS